MTKLIINVETGKTTERDLNKSELDQQKIDEAYQTEQEVLKSQKTDSRNALLQKLGITADEAALLLS
jgi:hypothetical protein